MSVLLKNLRKFSTVFLLFLIFLTAFSKNVFAVENPLDFPNNKFGIHILFSSEIEKAADFVNSSNGDWGYVTIPIQGGDRNLEKWQKFMDDARKLHVIPIIRLATEGDYFNTKVWRKPQDLDVLDFANFLNSLEWPIKNRYVIVFNEVNRADEWGNSVNPNEYADILAYAADVFKKRNEDFFILSAGLDNAASNNPPVSMDQYAFFAQMDKASPGIFGQIDGLASHSYPNPGFSQPPWRLTTKSISSFRYEKDLVFKLGGKRLPVFITETGWSQDKISKDQAASYYKTAFESVWNEKDVAAVTPFLLEATDSPFSQFALIGKDNIHSEIYETLEKMVKIKGQPTVATPSAAFLQRSSRESLPEKYFNFIKIDDSLPFKKVKEAGRFFKWFFGI